MENTSEFPFFGFSYQFPKDWHALDYATRVRENKERYDKQLREALQKNGPNTGDRTTEVFPNYNLLVVSSNILFIGDTSQLPRIVIWVHKRFSMLDKAGDHAGLLARIPNVEILRGPEEITLSAQRFIRAEYSFGKDSYLSQWVTSKGDYLIGFDLRARSDDELKELVQTMQTVRFASQDSTPLQSSSDSAQPTLVHLGGNVQAAKIIEHIQPVYPPLAGQTRTQGTVRLHVIVRKDGTIKQLQVVSGHPLLQQAAIDAVKQWRYAPTLLDGKRVEVDTTIDVVFALNENTFPSQPQVPPAPPTKPQ